MNKSFNCPFYVYTQIIYFFAKQKFSKHCRKTKTHNFIYFTHAPNFTQQEFPVTQKVLASLFIEKQV